MHSHSRVIIETYVPNHDAASEVVARATAADDVIARLDEVTSHYWWDSMLVHRGEIRLSFDAPAAGARDVIDGILDAHPYELPVVILRPWLPESRVSTAAADGMGIDRDRQK